MSSENFMEELNRYYSLWRETNYVYENWAKAHNLSGTSLFILSDIFENQDTCTQKKISQKWLIPKQTVNMALKEFERRGLVELLPMPEDKRNKIIRLTASGHEYANAILSELRQTELNTIAQISIERMRQLNDAMALFIELFSKNEEQKRHEAKV